MANNEAMRRLYSIKLSQQFTPSSVAPSHYSPNISKFIKGHDDSTPSYNELIDWKKQFCDRLQKAQEDIIKWIAFKNVSQDELVCNLKIIINYYSVQS